METPAKVEGIIDITPEEVTEAERLRAEGREERYISGWIRAGRIMEGKSNVRVNPPGDIDMAMKELIERYNAIPGVTPVTKFRDIATAEKRVAQAEAAAAAAAVGNGQAQPEAPPATEGGTEAAPPAVETEGGTAAPPSAEQNVDSPPTPETPATQETTTMAKKAAKTKRVGRDPAKQDEQKLKIDRAKLKEGKFHEASIRTKLVTKMVDEGAKTFGDAVKCGQSLRLTRAQVAGVINYLVAKKIVSRGD